MTIVEQRHPSADLFVQWPGMERGWISQQNLDISAVFALIYRIYDDKGLLTKITLQKEKKYMTNFDSDLKVC